MVRHHGIMQEKETNIGKRNVPVARGWLVFALGFSISLAALLIALRSERMRIDEDVSRNVDQQVEELRRGVERYVSVLTAVRVFFESSDSVDGAEFDHFAKQLVTLGPGVQAVEWVPSISGLEERRRLEETAGKWASGFSVKIPGPDSRLVRAPDEEREYLPIMHVFPLASNEPVVGYDLVSGPTIQFLRRAESSRKMVATDAFQLLQAHQGSPGWILVAPAFDRTDGSGIGASPQLLGFARSCSGWSR